MGNPVKTEAWTKLGSLCEEQELQDKILISDSLEVDFSKSLITDKVWKNLYELASVQDIQISKQKMLAMEPINHTENRSVGHVHLRSGQHKDVLDVLAKIKNFVERIHQEDKYTDIVHIGIGGSDLGPRFICRALRSTESKMNVHFVSNVDGADIEETLKSLKPETTLFVVASKTFTTQETMLNADFAKKWLKGLPIQDHIVAVAMNLDKAMEFGIHPDNIFTFWNWVGGRFSVWSAIGMTIALAYGYGAFHDLLEGGRSMDDHFFNCDIENNIPVLLALFGVWNRNFMNRSGLAVIPYFENLSLFPHFLQQLDMESNGKSVDRDGNPITDYKTAPILFGQSGTNSQHSFHQLLHQGTDIIPCEFIMVKESTYNQQHHEILNAHLHAQAIALFEGQENADERHRHYDGMRPSVTIKLTTMSAYALGQLVALYEHKIFVQGIIWNINSFDQYGVELGKALANKSLQNKGKRDKLHG